MYVATCDHCGHTGQQMHQIFIRRMETMDLPKAYCLCQKCFEKIQSIIPEINSNPQIIPEPRLAPEMMTRQSPPEPEQITFNPINDQMKGMLLRDFLQTPFYLNTLSTIIFKNREDTEIMDFKPYMDRPVLHIYMPGKTNNYTVVIE